MVVPDITTGMFLIGMSPLGQFEREAGGDVSCHWIPHGIGDAGSDDRRQPASGPLRPSSTLLRSLPPGVQSIDLRQGWKHRNRITLSNGHTFRPAAARTQRQCEEGIAKRSQRRWTSAKLFGPDRRTARISVYQGTLKVIWEMSVDYYDL